MKLLLHRFLIGLRWTALFFSITVVISTITNSNWIGALYWGATVSILFWFELRSIEHERNIVRTYRVRNS